MNRLDAKVRVWLSAPTLFLFSVFFLAPLLLMVRYSFAVSENLRLSLVWSFANYITIATQPIYSQLLLRSLGVAALVALMAIVLGFPAAWFIARAPERYRTPLLVLLIIPWRASYIVRVFAWYTLFGNSGVINKTLMTLGIVDEPLALFKFGLFGVIITELNLFLPLAIMPIYMALEKIDRNLILAARSLGARPMRIFRRIIWPLALPGVIAGIIFVFMPIAGTFVVPELVGGTAGSMLGKIIASQFGGTSNWALGAALSIFLLTALLACLAGVTFMRRRFSGEYY